MGGCVKNDKGKDAKEGKDGKEGKDDSGGMIAGAGVFSPNGAAGWNLDPIKRLFKVELTGRSDVALSDEIQERHTSNLRELNRKGVLDSCGAEASGEGGFMILAVEGPEDVDQLMALEPLLAEGVYSSFRAVEIVTPNNW